MHIIAAILALLTGIARGLGGTSLLIEPKENREIYVAAGLLIIALWLIISSVWYLAQKTKLATNLLTAGMIAFWIGGIINGYVLYGSPQLSGQVINLALVIAVIFGIRWKQTSN